MTDYWDQLLHRIQGVRNAYAVRKIPLKPGEGLTLALDEAEAAVKRTRSSEAATEPNFIKSACACHAVWNLHDVVTTCINGGLDVTTHLRQLTTGTTDYGVPADAATSHKTIYFKDFEAELFVAAQLVRAGLPVRFFEQSNDPRGEMYVGDVYIEVKHPNAAKRVERLVGEFNGELRRAGKYGVFVAALEDAFRLANPVAFATPTDFDAWRRQRRSQIESFGREVVRRAASLPAIAATVQTSSAVEVVGDESTMIRYGNAIVFDQRPYPPAVLSVVEKVAAAFNPQFWRYTQVQSRIVPGASPSTSGSHS